MEPYFKIVKPPALTRSNLDQLLALGWYRMHQMIFTTSHLDADHLHPVHWLRFEVAPLPLVRSHRKILSRNRTFEIMVEDVQHIRPEYTFLHQRYFDSITFDGAPSIQNCLFGDDLPGQSIYQTKCISVWDGEKVIAVGYFDVGENSAASILHFYDPAYSRYSLGKYLILLTLEYLKKQGYRYYYPGYVIETLPKMDYKLFLGRQEAWYFDADTTTWLPFQAGIINHRYG
jgi:leucyl-tRNA---protein transferase